MPGRFRFEVTPYWVEPINEAVRRGTRRIVCRKSAQVGWSVGVVMNLVLYVVDVRPCPVVLLLPREQSAVDFNDEKIEPAIEANPRLAEKIDLTSRAAGNRKRFKKFPGGFMKLLGSNAPPAVKSTTARLVIVEEPDDCNLNVRGQGDSIKLAEERAKAYRDALIVIGGTPTIAGVSAIDAEIAKTDRRLFHVPCHHCGDARPLVWENVRWDKDETNPHPVWGKHHPETAHYACPSCGGLWTDVERLRNVRGGWWVATAPFTGAAGFDGLNELYSPFPGSTMPRVVEKFLDASRAFNAGNAEKLIAFHNSSLGRSYEYRADLPPLADLEARAEDYPEWSVPVGGLVLVLGIDVQHDRLALTLWAYGRDMESWLIYWGEEYGHPPNKEDAIWSALDRIVDRQVEHVNGAKLQISAVSIDSSDGQSADAVYDWVRRHRRGRCNVMPIKGRSKGDGEIFSAPPAHSIDHAYNTKASRYGLKVYSVGTERAKDLILGFTADGGRIKRCDRDAEGNVKTGRGPGRMHWYQGVRPDFYEQLADSEVKAPSAKAGGRKVWTLKAGRRNEALDCTVYAEHAARALRLHLFNDADWRRLERDIGTNKRGEEHHGLLPSGGRFMPSPAVTLPTVHDGAGFPIIPARTS
jgi:phage terminase large subunit GpA-like protein